MNIRPRYNPPRSELRIANLKQRSEPAGRIMNLKMPNHIADAAAQMAHSLRTPRSKARSWPC